MFSEKKSGSSFNIRGGNRCSPYRASAGEFLNLGQKGHRELIGGEPNNQEGGEERVEGRTVTVSPSSLKRSWQVGKRGPLKKGVRGVERKGEERSNRPQIKGEITRVRKKGPKLSCGRCLNTRVLESRE